MGIYTGISLVREGNQTEEWHICAGKARYIFVGMPNTQLIRIKTVTEGYDTKR